jgi:hypothetical protein
MSDVIHLADGNILLPNNKVVTPEQYARMTAKVVEVPSHSEAQKLVMTTRRRLADLPAVPKTLNVINAVLAYEMFGLSKSEIALALNTTVEQVEAIQALPAYTEMFSAIKDSVIEAQRETVQGLLVNHAHDAATVIVEELSGDNPDRAMAAARDILDRTGHRPADRVEHMHRVTGGLRIEFVKQETMPVIDLQQLEGV